MSAFTLVPPSIIVPPMNVTVVSPKHAVFTCVADGVTIPAITWWRREFNDSLTQLSSDRINVTISDEDLDPRRVQSTLTILQSQPGDAAEYVCMAINEVDLDTASAALTVYGRYQLIYTVLGLYLCVFFNPLTTDDAFCVV